MAMDPQEMLRRRFRGGIMPGGIAGLLGAGPTEARRIGAMGMYIPAPMGGAGNTMAHQMGVAQGAWGQDPSQQVNRPVGTAGVGEPSVIPTMNPAGTGEAAWRTPTGAVIPEPQVNQAAQDAGVPMSPAPFAGGQQGSEEVRSVMDSSPVEPPSGPASVGSPTPPTGIIGAAVGTGSTVTRPPPTPAPPPVAPAAPFQPAAPQQPQPAPAPVQAAAPVQVAQARNDQSSYINPSMVNAPQPTSAGGGFSARDQGSYGRGGILSGFGSRRGILGFLSRIFGDWGGGR